MNEHRPERKIMTFEARGGGTTRQSICMVQECPCRACGVDRSIAGRQGNSKSSKNGFSRFWRSFFGGWHGPPSDFPQSGRRKKMKTHLARKFFKFDCQTFPPTFLGSPRVVFIDLGGDLLFPTYLSKVMKFLVAGHSYRNQASSKKWITVIGIRIETISSAFAGGATCPAGSF